MENEKRLIDALPFMRAGWHLVRTGKSNEYLASLSLADVPTVDAVEVVRCKDCKHYKPRNQSAHWEQKALCCTRSAWAVFPPDGFCSYGERREGE